MFDVMFKKKDSPQLQARIMLVRIQALKSLRMVDLAKDIGIHSNTLDMFLRRERDVRRDTLARILDYIKYEKEQGGIE